MTLYRKLVVGTTSVLALTIGSLFITELDSSRKNLALLQQQEIEQALDSATIALAPYLKAKDSIALDSSANVLFDSKSYSLVRLSALDYDYQFVKQYNENPTAAPDWFSNLKLFTAQHDKRIVQSNWTNLAEIEVVSHPGESTDALWQIFLNLAKYFGATFIVAFLLLSLTLRRAVAPVNAITRKMRELSNSQFGEPLKRPATSDLVTIVNGINTMSAQIEQSYKDQAKEAQRLRAQAYLDPISRFGNRSFYMSQLDLWLAEQVQGGIALLHAEYIGDIYKTKDYQRADAHVKELSQRLKNTIDVSGATIARLSSDEFGFLFPQMDESELRLLSETIMNTVFSISEKQTGVKVKASLGVVHCRGHRTRSDVLTMVDNALTKAKASPDKSYGFISTTERAINLKGKQQWKLLVEEAIKNNGIEFSFQAAKNAWGKVFHKEVFSSIERDGERFKASQYMFALEQVGAASSLDQHVIDAVITQLESGQVEGPIAINLAESSLVQPAFIRWLTTKLAKHSKIAEMLHFEISEDCFILQPHHTALICDAIRHAGAKFGVDNYGRNFESLEYLNAFRPDYVKLDYLFTHNLHNEKQKYTLASIARTAHNLNITAIASRVETQIQLDFLAEHFVEVFQGFIVDKE